VWNLGLGVHGLGFRFWGKKEGNWKRARKEPIEEYRV
jgi:hypothetical protein